MSPGDPIPHVGDTPTDAEIQLERLRRKLARERAARHEAETISERTTRELYDKQQGLVLLERVANAANEADTVSEALLSALDAVREHRSWPLGHAWLVNDQGDMIPTQLWSGDLERYGIFLEATRGLQFGRGEGLPGRVLVEQTPVWVNQPEQLAVLPRRDAILASDLKTALCFPLLARHDVVGVLEFFSERVMQPDEELLGLMGQIGTQLGRVVERQRAADTLEYQATHDALTGLPNRVLVLEHMRRALSRQSRREDERTAVFFVDLDGFKEVNDSLGHAAGDAVLREVATRLKSVIRPHDALGRLSGDEFVIVCEALTKEYPVATIAERLADVMRAPFEMSGESFQLTASVGISFAEGNEQPETLIEQADAAMYRSKEMGRGRYEIFSEDLRQRILRRFDLERALRQAVALDELRLHYQPEIDLRTGAIVGVEALLRWQRDDALVMPAEFIPLAEESGLIVGLGAWVLGEAARQSQRWQNELGVSDPPWTSVNLSVRQLSDPELIRTVESALADSGVDPAKLFLEVTESLILDDAEAGLTVLTELRALGPRIAIDDFGTGYSSLSYLRRFPASMLKIDRSFVQAIEEEPRSTAIVSAIIDMAHALGLRAVAEGIETAEQLAAVRELGCDLGQGYYFARPVPPEELASLLEQAPFAALLSTER